MRTIEQMVQQEILCCMSSLVSTLARGAYCLKPLPGTEGVAELMEQAFELASSVPDYEEAAIQAGWIQSDDGQWMKRISEATANYEGDFEFAKDARRACDYDDLEPIDSEVYEHWAVTDWFADKLIAQGEKVDKDFGNLCIWARTTTGQAISMDGCVQRIYEAMMQPVEA